MEASGDGRFNGRCMTDNYLRRTISWIAEKSSDPAAGDDLRVQQALLLGGSFMFVIAGVAWGIAYFFFDEPQAALIPLSYSVVSALSVALYLLTSRYRFFRASQLFLILVLPFALQIALGGFVNSSAVILWSLLSPFGALLFDEPRRAPRWFLGFLVLVVASGLLQPYVRSTNNLSDGLVVSFFVANVGAVSTIAFVLIYSFVRQQRTTLRLLRDEQVKSDSLLLNILPKEIAAILKSGRRTIADQFEGASILFADM
jgi:adenylate cyclase